MEDNFIVTKEAADAATAIADTMATSLDNTQKNSTDTSGLVDQVTKMSGQNLHEETVRAILSDANISSKDKLDLIHSENGDYDQRLDNNTGRVERLQSAQTSNVSAATGWWAQNWGWVLSLAIPAGIGIGCCTPGGRRFVKSMLTNIISLPA